MTDLLFEKLPITGGDVQPFFIVPGHQVHGPAKAPRICADHEPQGVGTTCASRIGRIL